MKNKFQGLWPAMFTPVSPNGSPAYDQLEKLTDLLVSQNLDGLYILGSTGQGVLFSEEERKRVTEVVMRTVAKRVPVMVQVGSLTTAESVRLAEHAGEMGADGISSVGPIYFSGPANMALMHYKSIAQAVDVAFFPYQLGNNSIPGEITEFIDRLMEIPNVEGMKLTTENLLEISLIHNHAGEGLRLFSGSDELLCHASLCGTVGAIGSFYNLWGVECKQAIERFRQGEFDESKKFMLTFQDVISEVLPDIWTFFRSAMLIKYNIDIGQSKAPLGNGHGVWDEADVVNLLRKIEELTK